MICHFASARNFLEPPKATQLRIRCCVFESGLWATLLKWDCSAEYLQGTFEVSSLRHTPKGWPDVLWVVCVDRAVLSRARDEHELVFVFFRNKALIQTAAISKFGLIQQVFAASSENLHSVSCSLEISTQQQAAKKRRPAPDGGHEQCT